MAAASSSLRLSSSVLSAPGKKPRFCHSFRVKAQGYRDHEAKSSNIVDANMGLLRERMNEVRIKERLERCCCVDGMGGWNYGSYDVKKQKREEGLIGNNLAQLMGTVGGTFGFTLLTCTFSLCLFSLLLHSTL